MTTFSANLGFLWTELALPERIRAAKAAGFAAVECHSPYDTPPEQLVAALQETGLSMLGLNTRRGHVDKGDNGLSAVPGRESEARAAIDEAIAYAAAINTPNIHVMAGFASGAKAHDAFISSLRYACKQGSSQGLTMLIEPLNKYDAPGYFLQTSSQAVKFIDEIAAPNLKLMFDCYHLQLMEGDLTHRLTELHDHIGHIQFASVPDRGPPDHGELNYAYLFDVIANLGYAAPLGAEYKPVGKTEESLGWMRSLA